MSAKRILTTAGYLSEGVLFVGLDKLKNNLVLNLSFLLLSVLLLAPALGPVPSSNENIYLLFLAKLWDPSLLVTDWTFAGPFYGHLIFSYLFGSLTLLFSLEAVAWIGRVLSWIFLLLGLMQIGKQFQIPLWMISIVIFLWLLYQQSLVGGEWVLGTFEAKGIAYICLFFALSEFMKGRELVGALLLGLCFTFHGVVGMWALLAVGLSVVFLKYPVVHLAKMAVCVLVTAAPGLIVTLPVFSGEWALSPEEAKFLAVVLAPFHLDPLSFPKRDVVLLLVLFSFVWLTFRSTPNDKRIRFLQYFLTSLGLFYLAGVVARLHGSYGFLAYYPFRLFPVFVPLLFFFSLMSVCYKQKFAGVAGRPLLVIGLIALLGLPGALGVLIEQTKLHYRMWATYYDWDDLQKCFLWVGDNTPKDAVVVLPPWKKESYYLTRRATIVHWASPRMDRFKEWHERIVTLVGSSSTEDEQLGEKWREHYNDLSEAQIAGIIAKYGGEYWVSEADYSFPVLFTSGTYRVYSIPNLANSSNIEKIERR